jgi:hypothetical protein
MRLNAIYILSFLIWAGDMPLRVTGQNVADPLSGAWLGDYGPTAAHRVSVTVDLKWDGKILTGVANPGPIPFKNSTFDPKTGAVHLEADVFFMGNKVRYVMNGKIDNGVLLGTWKHGDKKGDFRLFRR